MGRHLQRNLSLESQSHSCAWGIFHLFDFHQRLNISKMLPDGKHGGGKHGGGKHAGGNKGSKTKLVSTNDVTQELIDPAVDCSRSHEDEGNHKSKSKGHSKKTIRGRIKVLIEKEMAMGRGKKRINPALAPRLQRLYSIHHMEGDDLDLPEEAPSHDQNSSPTDSNGSTPLELQNNCCKRCEACGILNSPEMVNTNLSELGRQLLEKQAHLRVMLEEVKKTLSHRRVSGTDVAEEVGFAKSQEILDVVEEFNNNQELFVKMLEQKGSAAPPKHIRGSSFPEAILTKARLSGTEDKDDTHLKLKELNTGSLAKKRGKPISGSKSTESALTGSSEATAGESTPLRVDEKDKAETETSVSLPGVTHRSKKSRFKSIKRKLAHAIRGNKKERHRVALDGILHKIPYGHDVSEELKSVTEREREDGRSPGVSNAGDGPRMRRSASLGESLDRYSRLFESNFGNKPRINRSRTLKLTDSRNEDANMVDGKPGINFGRVRSLPSLHSFQLQSDAENEETRQTVAERSRLGWSIEGETNGENSASGPIGRPAADADFGRDDQDCCRSNEFHGMITKDTNNKATEPSPISVLNSCFQEDVFFPENSSAVEETSELKAGSAPFSEAETSTAVTRREEQSETEDDAAGVEAEVIDSESLLSYEFEEREEAEFKYVREILRRSGLTGSELLGSWYAPQQPLDPSLFDELATQQVQYDASGKVASLEAYLEHLLLFDLLNEALLEVYERSYTPLPWSSAAAWYQSLSRPMPVGRRVLEEVWSVVSWHLNLQPQVDTLVEYVVGRDLTKYDGWMNLQMDVESLALDFEDWILDDLLDEVVFELVP